MRRKFISILVAVMLVFTLMPTTAFASTVVQTWDAGQFGTGITATLDVDGTLTFTGLGALKGFAMGTSPVKDNISVKRIIIGEGITAVGQKDFYGCTALKEVLLPSSVTNIGANAFYGCTSLEAINIHEGITSIGSFCFANCTSLKTITLPASLWSVGSAMFDGCTSLTTIINKANNQAFGGVDTFELVSNGTAYGFSTNIGYIGAVQAAGYTFIAFDKTTTSSGSSISTDVIGIIEPIDLAATATLSTYLAIDPNITGAAAFISPTITVKNDCNAPIEAYAVSCKASGAAPKVTANGAKDWDKLNTADTAAFISLGLSGGEITGTYWFAEEASQAQQHIGSMAVGESDQFSFHGAFGRTWSEQKALKYQLVMKIGLKS